MSSITHNIDSARLIDADHGRPQTAVLRLELDVER
jgi:hypothetical protein